MKKQTELLKVAAFDLETSDLKADFGILLVACVQEQGGKPWVYTHDDPQWSDDSAIVAATIEELSQYDVLVAHNGTKFDLPWLNSRASHHGLAPLPPTIKIIDPVLIARKRFHISYNGLDRVASFLSVVEKKTPVDGQVWVRATLDRDPEALEYIRRHCIRDVEVLNKVMARMRPYLGRINEWGSA